MYKKSIKRKKERKEEEKEEEEEGKTTTTTKRTCKIEIKTYLPLSPCFSLVLRWSQCEVLPAQI